MTQDTLSLPRLQHTYTCKTIIHVATTNRYSNIQCRAIHVLALTNQNFQNQFFLELLKGIGDFYPFLNEVNFGDGLRNSFSELQTPSDALKKVKNLD